MASIAKLQGVTGDHGRGGMGCDEQSKATEVAGTVWGQFVEHVSNWEVQRPIYEEEPRKK